MRKQENLERRREVFQIVNYISISFKNSKLTANLRKMDLRRQLALPLYTFSFPTMSKKLSSVTFLQRGALSSTLRQRE